jgi:hypothetical protein
MILQKLRLLITWTISKKMIAYILRNMGTIMFIKKGVIRLSIDILEGYAGNGTGEAQR